MKSVDPTPLRGYIEGYYGRLLGWSDRRRLLETLNRLSLNTYFYAPKEDIRHRLHWRDDYSPNWRTDFRKFCALAENLNVSILAGIAPGLDFDFAQIDGNDFQLLVNKARKHLDDGVSFIVLCMDDIDENFHQRSGAFKTEGEAHASLANRLSAALAMPIFVVPRVYSNDIAVDSPAYPEDFARTIDPENPVFLCGSDIVAQSISDADLSLYTRFMTNRVIVWDNLYANDYCPRRLFVGPWTGRDGAKDILINPTGLIETDVLLLTIMSDSAPGTDKNGRWRQVIQDQQVPTEFLAVSSYFNHPSFPDYTESVDTNELAAALDALEFLLWKWKTPLSREWYRYFMELKQDLLLSQHELPDIRIRKTQSIPLAARLLGR